MTLFARHVAAILRVGLATTATRSRPSKTCPVASSPMRPTPIRSWIMIIPDHWTAARFRIIFAPLLTTPLHLFTVFTARQSSPTSSPKSPRTPPHVPVPPSDAAVLMPTTPALDPPRPVYNTMRVGPASVLVPAVASSHHPRPSRHGHLGITSSQTRLTWLHDLRHGAQALLAPISRPATTTQHRMDLANVHLFCARSSPVMAP